MANTALGRLTVDLMMKTAGLEKGTREGRKQFRSLDKQVKSVEKTIEKSMKAAAAATAAYAASVGYITVKQMELIKTQSNLASSLNSTITGLKAVNDAATDKGIGGMESALARLQRRLGAVENGTGPAVKAVQALQLDTQKLANLDADKKIQYIADAIENAGITSQQATRYLQDLGFQQAGVAELFKNGAKELDDYREFLEKTGQAVSALDAAKISAAKVEFDLLGTGLEGIKTQLAVQLSGAIGVAAQEFNKWSQDGVSAADRVSSAIDKTYKAVGFIADGFYQVKNIGEAAGLGVTLGFFKAREQAYELAAAVGESVIGSLNSMLDLMNKIPGVSIEAFNSKALDNWNRELGVTQVAIAMVYDEMGDLANRMNDLPSHKIEEFRKQAEAWGNDLQPEITPVMSDEAVAAVYEKQAEMAQYELEMAKLKNEDLAEIAELEWHAKMALLEDQLEEREITEEQFMMRSELAWEQYNQNLAQIEQQYNQQKLQGTKQIFANLSTLMNTENRKMFEIGKAAAYANTIVSTSEAAMNAYKAMAGIPYVGPALGAAAAGAAIIAGGVQLDAISRTKFGSKQAPTSTPTEQINAASTGVGDAPRQDIYISGLEKDSIYSGEQVLELVNEAVSSGGRLVGVSY